jgi:hypothetical protein
LFIRDVVIIRSINFGTIGNVGHMDGKKIGDAKITIPPKVTIFFDQSLAMEPTWIHVPIMHAPKNFQISNDKLRGQQHP